MKHVKYTNRKIWSLRGLSRTKSQGLGPTCKDEIKDKDYVHKDKNNYFKPRQGLTSMVAGWEGDILGKSMREKEALCLTSFNKAAGRYNNMQKI